MKRVAVLIGASRIPNEDFLPGAERDVAMMRDWLTSDAGGSWNRNEVIQLVNPGRSRVGDALAVASAADYAFITYSGHGWARNTEIDGMSVCLADAPCSALELLPAAARATLIIDACRTIMRDDLRKAFDKVGELRESERGHRARCRALFDKYISECEEGAIVLCSCSPGQAAGESTRGGFFTRGLVDYSASWAEVNSGKRLLLRLPGAFSGAVAFTKRLNPPQQPQYVPGRRHRHFPFAIAL